MPKTEKQLADLRTEKRALIKNAALEVFSAYGYQKASISNIAKHAGISKGLIYNYFESKEVLITEIMLGSLEEYLNIFDPDKDGVLTREEFNDFIDKIFITWKENYTFWRMYLLTLSQPDVLKLIEPKTEQILEPFLKLLVGYFTRKGCENPEGEAYFTHMVFDGIFMNYISNPDGFPVESIKQILKDKFL